MYTVRYHMKSIVNANNAAEQRRRKVFEMSSETGRNY